MNFTALGDIAEFINGAAFKPTDWGSVGLKIVRIQNLTNPKATYNLTSKEVAPKYEIKKDDILVSWSASLGVFKWEKEETALLNQHIFKVIPDETKVCKAYLLHVLKKALIDMSIHLHGATMKHVNRGEFLATKIPLPPLAEQKRIAAILDKADALRRKREKAIALTDTLLRSVFVDMFGDPVTNPKGWEEVHMGKVGEIITGNTPSRNRPEYFGKHIEWIKSDNINNPYHYLTEAVECLSEDGVKVGRTVPKNSLLVTCIAGSKQCIGNIAISDRPVAFNQQINSIIPNDNVLYQFLYSQLAFNKSLVQRASTNSMKGMVSKSKFSMIKVIVPPLSIQSKYVEVFEKMIMFENKLRDYGQKSDNNYLSLTQRAFRGDLTGFDLNAIAAAE